MDIQTQRYIEGALLLILVFLLGRMSAGARRAESQRPAPTIYPAPAPGDGKIDEAQLLEYLRAGRMIDAIKLYRQHHRSDLREAKRAVEALAERHGIRH